jgi:hypothetical protein
MGNELISIETLEQGLKNAERELARAATDRMRATEVEAEWQTEVTSLKNLIQVRKQRMNLKIVKESPVEESGEPREDYSGGTLSMADNGTASEALNKVEWIDGLIAASGTMGIAPPEIMKAAEKDQIKMHPNYPYVVLRKLVEKERAVKRRGRYYKKGI